MYNIKKNQHPHLKYYTQIHQEDILTIPTSFLRTEHPKNHSSFFYIIFYKF